jgi:hypothetical protein
MFFFKIHEAGIQFQSLFQQKCGQMKNNFYNVNLLASLVIQPKSINEFFGVDSMKPGTLKGHSELFLKGS